MKNAFKSFSVPDEKTLQSAWHSQKTLFILDANVLLNVYGYEEQTKNDFFDALEAISDRIWIPHQVGLEYNRRRLDVIKQEKKTFRDVNAALDKILSDAKDNLKDRKFWQKIPELEQQLNHLQNAISVEIEKCKERVLEWDKLQPDVRSEDEILDKIDALTADKIGPPPPDQAWLDKVFSEGKSRFELKIPPGFQDAGKGKGDLSETTFSYNKLTYQRQFGDLIIWMQTLEKAKTDKIQSVFFITDDAKTDWWTIIDSGGKKIIGPNEGLKNEFYHETNAELFHMYNTTNFLTESKRFLNTKVLDTSLQDISNKSNSALEAEERNKERQAETYAFFNKNILLYTSQVKPNDQKFEIKINKNPNSYEAFIKDPELVELIASKAWEDRIRSAKEKFKTQVIKELFEQSSADENVDVDIDIDNNPNNL